MMIGCPQTRDLRVREDVILTQRKPKESKEKWGDTGSEVMEGDDDKLKLDTNKYGSPKA